MIARIVAACLASLKALFESFLLAITGVMPSRQCSTCEQAFQSCKKNRRRCHALWPFTRHHKVDFITHDPELALPSPPFHHTWPRHARNYSNLSSLSINGSVFNFDDLSRPIARTGAQSRVVLDQPHIQGFRSGHDSYAVSITSGELSYEDTKSIRKVESHDDSSWSGMGVKEEGGLGTGIVRTTTTEVVISGREEHVTI
ncbi:hypothetical protein BDV96DRAFT_569096 [Lophiotrema nucula]|uniref:Zn(2)-C6 fungal-type domain-containing protein n=1 Tax=Lophiotrema nucula TaxID=690887 RepID=A0A6A5ZLM4_9PLEO|nr:hypothetical protein BDV96DRAFT_569096 [Lophiotrema nucula]